MRRILLTIAAVSFAGMIAIGTAHAYSIASGTDGLSTVGSSTGGLNSILAPFTNFFKSISSVSVVGPSVGVQSIPKNDFFVSAIQGAFQRFDAWLYGVAGFHISGLFTAILGIFSWLLGLVKGGVDWLLSVVH